MTDHSWKTARGETGSRVIAAGENRTQNPLRAKSNFPSDLKLIWVASPGKQKFRFTILKIRTIFSVVSCPHEGRIAIVTTRWARDAMDAAFQRRMKLSRTAKSCGSDAAMLASSS
jgi:hypothetical protein